jgi:hypothetical protein
MEFWKIFLRNLENFGRKKNRIKQKKLENSSQVWNPLPPKTTKSNPKFAKKAVKSDPIFLSNCFKL